VTIAPGGLRAALPLCLAICLLGGYDDPPNAGRSMTAVGRSISQALPVHPGQFRLARNSCSGARHASRLASSLRPIARAAQRVVLLHANAFCCQPIAIQLALPVCLNLRLLVRWPNSRQVQGGLPLLCAWPCCLGFNDRCSGGRRCRRGEIPTFQWGILIPPVPRCRLGRKVPPFQSAGRRPGV